MTTQTHIHKPLLHKAPTYNHQQCEVQCIFKLPHKPAGQKSNLQPSDQRLMALHCTTRKNFAMKNYRKARQADVIFQLINMYILYPENNAR